MKTISDTELELRAEVARLTSELARVLTIEKAIRQEAWQDVIDAVEDDGADLDVRGTLESWIERGSSTIPHDAAPSAVPTSRRAMLTGDVTDPSGGLLDPILAKLEAHVVLLAAGQRTAQATNERLDELIHDGKEAIAELRRNADGDRRDLGKACERSAHRIDALEARVAALEPSPAPPWEPRVVLATALHVGDPPGSCSSASTTTPPLAFQVGTRSETPAEPTLRELQAADRAQPSPDVCSWCEGNGGTPACGSCGKVRVAS